MSFEIEIDVECVECGEELEVEYSQGTLHVQPCETCLERLENDTRSDAEESMQDELQDQYDLGYQAGFEDAEEKLQG